MKVHAMNKAVIDRIQQLDRDTEYRALTEHVAVVSPIAIELLSYENLSSPAHEARRIAAIQLRIVTELAPRLQWLDRTCIDPEIAPELRVALAGILRGLCQDTDMLPIADSEAAALLEPALLFHELLANLHPWLPPMVIEFEPEPVLDLVRLGIPDYLHPLLRARFEALWALFHRLRQLPPARLRVLTDAPTSDDEGLVLLIEDPSLAPLYCPPAPTWTTPSWASPWLGEGDSPLHELPALALLELTNRAPVSRSSAAPTCPGPARPGGTARASTGRRTAPLAPAWLGDRRDSHHLAR